MSCIGLKEHRSRVGPKGQYNGHVISKIPRLTTYHNHPTKCTYQTSHKYLPQASKGYVYLDDCAHNELGALLDRHLKEQIPLQTAELVEFKQACKDIADAIGQVSPITPEQFVSSYTGRKRKLYDRALANVRDVQFPDSRIKTFVKKERHLGEKYKAARLIQARSPEFNIRLGEYLKPIEHRLYNLVGDGKKLPKGPVCAKGHNVKERARIILDMMAQFRDPMVIAIDAEAFDSSVNDQHLSCEHMAYLRCHGAKKRMRRNHKRLIQLNWLLRRQMRNKCKTKHGIRYNTKGSRCSGDLNTACGNCLINLAMLMCACRRYIVGKYCIYVDGDDSVLICETSSNVGNITRDRIKPFGFNAKIEEFPHAKSTDFEFCQGKIIRTINGPVFINNPIKKISVLGDHFRLSMPEVDYLYNLGVMEYALNAGVPVLQEYAMKLMHDNRSTGRRVKEIDYAMEASGDNTWYRYKQLIKTDPHLKHVITEQARKDFESAFSISVEEQLRMERVIRAGKSGPLDKTCAFRKEIFPSGNSFYKFDRYPRDQYDTNAI